MIVGLGSNYFGQLALVDGDQVQRNFISTNFAGGVVAKQDVQDIVCGSQFTVVVLKSGSLLLCGSLIGSIYPTLTPIVIPYPVKCIQVACGRKHILALMERGLVLSWGSGLFGQLGHGDDENRAEPRPIRSLNPSELRDDVVQLVCGSEHSGARTRAGRLFMWGLNKNLQCGTGLTTETITDPRPVDMSAIGRASALVCGRFHSGALNSNGHVFTWGSATLGRLGLPSAAKRVASPTEVTAFRRCPVVELVSGDFHMLALCRDKSVYSWGCGTDGAHGHGHLYNLKSPELLDDLRSADVVSVACGSSWSMAVTASGALYAWGNGDGGWLGMEPFPGLPFLDSDSEGQSLSTTAREVRSFDSRINVLVPTVVRQLRHMRVERVSCGGGHVVILASSRATSTSTSQSLPPSRVTAAADEAEEAAMLDQMFRWIRHNKYSELERFLCDKDSSININATDAAGNTALLIACQNGHIPIVRLLLEFGADVHCRNHSGNTVLHYCFAYGFHELGHYLVNQGVDEFAANLEGLTCYEGLSLAELEDL